MSCEYQIPPPRGGVHEWTDQESCWIDDLASVPHDTSATAVAISVWQFPAPGTMLPLTVATLLCLERLYSPGTINHNKLSLL